MTTATSRIRPGVRVVKDGQVLTVVDIADLETAIVSAEGGTESLCPISELQVVGLAAQPVRTRDIATYAEGKWNRADEIARNLQSLMGVKRSERRAAVANVAGILGLSESSIYRLLARYRDHGRVSFLLRPTRSDRGKTRLSQEAIAIVDAGIQKHYLTEHRKSVSSVWREIDRACKEAAIPTPTVTTVRNIIYRLDPSMVEAKRYSRKQSEAKYAPQLGSFPNANNPYEVIQIDHTPMDVIIVDDVHRKPIGRAYLTIAFDVRTKMVTGFVISIDHPGALATGMCVAMSILPKDEWLRERRLHDVGITWPCYGIMRTVHTDNAKEFRGKMLKFACNEYNISLEKRRKGAPQYGGGVERAFRTFMTKVHEELPGTTRSNVLQRAEYNSEGRAVLSLGALERWFAVYLLGEYHRTPHAGNQGVAPLDVWTEAHLQGLDGGPPVGLPIPMTQDAAERLRLDFLPLFETTVQQYGVRSWSIDWYSPLIRRHIAAKTPDGKGRKFICRYDPRNLEQIWFFDDVSNVYIPLPYRVSTRPPVSLWEVKQAKNALRSRGSPTTNEALIFNAVDLAREIIKKEAALTKSARRQAQRQAEWKKATGKRAHEGVTQSKSNAPSPIDDGPLPAIDLLRGAREAS